MKTRYKLMIFFFVVIVAERKAFFGLSVESFKNTIIQNTWNETVFLPFEKISSG